MDYLKFIFQAINNLLTQNLGFFDAMGQNLFRSFATILVVWYGVKAALSSASGKHFFRFDNFASLLLTSTFFLDNPGALLEGLRCFAASRPLPGPETRRGESY